jgi:Fe-S-cluster-containing dehydrogenase component
MVACQRNWARTNGDITLVANGTAERIEPDDVTVVKAQKANDSPPFVSYRCWNCTSPPCAGAAGCPRGAISKKDDGEVVIDRALCQPGVAPCNYYPGSRNYECVRACGRGGYPKIGYGDGVNFDAYKCDLCFGRRVPASPSKILGSYEGDVPACVQACPFDSLVFGTRTDIEAYVNSLGLTAVKAGEGSVFWVSMSTFSPPTADPYVEDHIASVFEKLLVGPLGKVLLVPTLIAGGLYALYNRRLSVESEAKEG